MDPYEVMEQWLAAGLGKQGRALQGTSPVRYRTDVESWLRFIESATGIGAFNAVEAHVETWLSARHHPTRAAGTPRPNRSPHNRDRRLSALSAFYNYAVNAGHIDTVPLNLAMLRTTELPRTTPLTPREALYVWIAADDLLPGEQHHGAGGATPHRDRLMAYLMLDGLRPRQITALDLEDLNPTTHTAKILVAKGDGTRQRTLSLEVWGALDGYLPHRKPGRDNGHEPLLTSRAGKRLDSNQTPTTVLKRVLGHVPADFPLPDRVTPDHIALSPSPFTGQTRRKGTQPGEALAYRTTTGTWTTTPADHELPLQLRIQHHLRGIGTLPPCADHPVDQAAPAGDCAYCDTHAAAWDAFAAMLDDTAPACWDWEVPPYAPYQDPIERFLNFHAGQCAMCGNQPAQQPHTEDFDADTQHVRGLLCPTCTTEQDDSPRWDRYRDRGPAMILGLVQTYPWLRGRR
ncbi:tyrosine-type recombinase/integrase [Streptomyces sp. NBC_01431]|uniref:tyrosine-type recombinase/integrase n=1 Tax=Streptomyces sp. NBC_01431 TaxID=2903863 RepID=UPI002E34B30B|nr:endonuclease domain-containing protein [Streptomyces sp. NBC_01431]